MHNPCSAGRTGASSGIGGRGSRRSRRERGIEARVRSTSATLGGMRAALPCHAITPGSRRSTAGCSLGRLRSPLTSFGRSPVRSARCGSVAACVAASLVTTSRPIPPPVVCVARSSKATKPSRRASRAAAAAAASARRLRYFWKRTQRHQCCTRLEALHATANRSASRIPRQQFFLANFAKKIANVDSVLLNFVETHLCHFSDTQVDLF